MIPSTIRVRLLREHIIDAKTFKAGMVVTLPAQSAQFLCDLRVGELADKDADIPVLSGPSGSVSQKRSTKNP